MRSTVTLGKINLSTAQVRESVALTTPKICIFTLKERPDIHCGVSHKLCSSWGNIVRFFRFWLCLASITVQKSCQICPTLQVAYYCKSYFWHRDKWDFFFVKCFKKCWCNEDERNMDNFTDFTIISSGFCANNSRWSWLFCTHSKTWNLNEWENKICILQTEKIGIQKS